MLHYMKHGLRAAWKQPFVVITLFVYQLLWGFFLYKMIASIIVPILHRYPGADQGMTARYLFYSEGQFQLMKTNLPDPYLWLLLVLLILRMVLNPIINAGVYYSLAHEQLNSGYRFVSGIRQLTLPYLVYYFIQTALTLLPIIWLGPKALTLIQHEVSLFGMATALLPWIAGYAAYGYLLHLGFMFIQFGKLYDIHPFSALIKFLRYSPLVIGLAFVLLCITGVFTAAAITASYIWAGLIGLMLYQLFPLLQMFCRVWSIAVQHELWNAKTSDRNI